MKSCFSGRYYRNRYMVDWSVCASSPIYVDSEQSRCVWSQPGAPLSNLIFKKSVLPHGGSSELWTVQEYFVCTCTLYVSVSIDCAAVWRCDESDCQGLLRPNVVFFGETLDSHILTKVEKELEVCDLCLVVSCPEDGAVCHTHSVVIWSGFFTSLMRRRGSPPEVNAAVTAPYRSAHRPSFTRQPCLVLRLHLGASQWPSSTHTQHPNPSTSRELVMSEDWTQGLGLVTNLLVLVLVYCSGAVRGQLR